MKSINELEKIIPEYAQSYYAGTPVITDDEFDSLVEDLRAQNPEHPLLSTTGWGMKVPKQKTKVKHLYEFATGISDKIRPEEFTKFMKNRHIKLSQCVVSTKLDGASVLCYYTDGKLHQCITRGDGTEGLDVTDRIKLLIPNNIDPTFTGVIRGEFILPEDKWIKYKGSAKSSRNFSAGKLNADNIDSSIKDHRLVTYFVRSVDEKWDIQRQFQFLLENRFTVAPHYIFCGELQEEFTTKFAQDFLDDLNGGVYQCDGIVVAYGEQDRFAIKWNTIFTESVVTDIKWQNSRLGRLKPTVIIEPVDISGATIQRVTGNNYQWILDRGLGIGSKIRITRSGEVIPKIEEVLTKSDDSKIPDKCPYCKQKLEVNGVDLVCPNHRCPGRGETTLQYFITTTIPVNGLGDNIVAKFLPYFDIHSILDLIHVAQSDYRMKLLTMCKRISGFGESTYTKIDTMLRALNGSLKMKKVLIGLGLPSLGERTIQSIFDRYTWDGLLTAIEEHKLVPFSGVNYLAIQSLYDYKPYILEVINSLKNFPVLPLNHEERNAIIKSSGVVNICITGALSVSRREFIEECKEMGIEEVSIAKANILITNTPDSNTTKNKEARKRGTIIMSEEEFRGRYLNVQI